MTPDAGHPVALQWFEPDLKAVGAVERALRAAVGDQGWGPVAEALRGVLIGPATPAPSETKLARANATLTAALDPSKATPVPPWAMVGAAIGDLVDAIHLPHPFESDPRLEFTEGLVAGCGEGIVEEAKAQVQLIKQLVQALADFYSMAYDARVLVKLFEVWFADPVGSPLDELEGELESDYPRMWVAIRNMRPLLTGLDSVIASLRDKTAADALSMIGDWLNGLPEAVGGALKPHIDAIVSAKGDPLEQGKIVGRVAGPLILQVVLAALDLASLGQHIAEFFAKEGPLLLARAGDLAETTLQYARRSLRATYSDAELGFAAAETEKVAQGTGAAAARVVDEVLHQLTEEWGELGYRIAPYRINSGETGAWNKAVREYTGLSTKDLEYAVSLRLDSNHIIEDRWFDVFPDEFKKVFKDWQVLDSRGNPVLVDGEPLVVSWNSAKDMDAFAIHTEAHIRSGERMATDKGLLGGEGRDPLAPEMDKFFAKLQTGKDGVRRPFTNLREVLEAHKRFYQEERTGTLWPRLSNWFARATEALDKAGLP